jgi:hypothetical protein
MKEISKQIILRTVGIALMSFIPGMGIGAAANHGDWVMGGIIATGTALSTVIIYLGVVLTWSGTWTTKDVETAYRAAAAKAAEGNDEVKEALDTHVAEEGTEEGTEY